MILVTHVDLDGAGCALVARSFFKELGPENIYHCNYDIVDELVIKLLETTEEKIIITDVSVNEESGKIIEEKYKGRVELFDHHKTSKILLDIYEWTLIDQSKSATKVFFDELCRRYPEKKITEGLKKLVFHVNDVDLWIHESPDSQKFNDLLWLLGMETFLKVMLDRSENGTPLIEKSDMLFLKGLADNKRKYFEERVAKAVVLGNRLVITASRHQSELAQYVRDVGEQHPEWSGVKYVDMLNFESCSHGLRSYDLDFDVSEVAVKHGGGGHPRASGYSMNVEKYWMRDF